MSAVNVIKPSAKIGYSGAILLSTDLIQTLLRLFFLVLCRDFFYFFLICRCFALCRGLSLCCLSRNFGLDGLFLMLCDLYDYGVGLIHKGKIPTLLKIAHSDLIVNLFKTSYIDLNFLRHVAW